MTAFVMLLAAAMIKATVLLVAAIVVVWLLRQHSAAARHAVWGVALIAIVVLPALTAVLPPLRLRAGSLRLDEFMPAAARPQLTMPVASAPVSFDVIPRAAAGSHVHARTHGVVTVIVTVWLLGVVLLVVRRVMAEVRVRGMLRRARAAADGRWRVRCAQAVRPWRTGRRFELCLSDETSTPAVIGVFSSVLIFPALADDWSHADINAALVHEYGHIVRRDCLLNAIADLAVVLYWCNPLVHLAARRMRTESERACDDRVVLSGADPAEYAQLLLRIARSAHLHGQLPAAATAMAQLHQLESRIRAVLDVRIPRAPVPRWAIAGVAGIALSVALPIAALTLGAPPLQAQILAAPEPDRRGDALAAPLSERLPLAADVYDISAGARQAHAGPDSALVRLLIAALARAPQHESDLVRERAAWALSQATDGRLIEPVLHALNHRDWRVQSYAAWTLGTAREQRAVERLVPLLQHPVWRLRAMAAYALHAVADPRAAPAMSAALADPAWQVRAQAVEYFGALQDARFAPALRPLLDDRHIAVRIAAQHALATPY